MTRVQKERREDIMYVCVRERMKSAWEGGRGEGKRKETGRTREAAEERKERGEGM